MKKIIATASALAVAPLLSACADTPRVPEHGTVIATEHRPSWVQIVPGTTICTGNPMQCTATPPQFIPHAETWDITIRDRNNPDWKGTVTDYTSDTYDKCHKGDLWPECWKN